MGPLLHTAPAWCINANDLGLEASYECGDVSAMRLTDLSDGSGLVCWLSDGVGGPHPFSLSLALLLREGMILPFDRQTQVCMPSCAESLAAFLDEFVNLWLRMYRVDINQQESTAEVHVQEPLS